MGPDQQARCHSHEYAIAAEGGVGDHPRVEILVEDQRSAAFFRAEPIDDVAPTGSDFLKLFERDLNLAERSLMAQPLPEYLKSPERIGFAISGDEGFGIEEVEQAAPAMPSAQSCGRSPSASLQAPCRPGWLLGRHLQPCD